MLLRFSFLLFLYLVAVEYGSLRVLSNYTTTTTRNRTTRGIYRSWEVRELFIRKNKSFVTVNLTSKYQRKSYYYNAFRLLLLDELKKPTPRETRVRYLRTKLSLIGRGRVRMAGSNLTANGSYFSRADTYGVNTTGRERSFEGYYNYLRRLLAGQKARRYPNQAKIRTIQNKIVALSYNKYQSRYRRPRPFNRTGYGFRRTNY